jgi:DNA modification methylase
MSVRIVTGGCLTVLPTLVEKSVQTCVTSPPYFGLRDYGHPDQIGLEKTPEEYVEKLVAVFREVRRVLKDDGTLWLNLGDSYANGGKWGGSTGGLHMRELHGTSSVGRTKRSTGLKPKDLIGIPWRVAFALQEDGWYLRSDIIWSKPNPMPESVEDRPTKAHEYLFLLSKDERYYYDAEAIAEPATTGDHARNGKIGSDHQAPGQSRQNGISRRRTGAAEAIPAGTMRNRRSVWTISSEPYAGAHFAVMPTALVAPCILAGSRIGDVVLDPFGGSGTVGAVATELGRHATLIELNPEYVSLASERTAQESLFAQPTKSIATLRDRDVLPEDTKSIATLGDRDIVNSEARRSGT